jgi:hypothetical protein
MAKTCAQCGGENLDFKVFCGFCGAALQDRSHEGGAEPEVKVPQNHTSQDHLADLLTSSLGNSKILGLILFLTPLILTLLTIPLLWQLIESDLASYELMFGIAVMVFIEAIVCVGIAVQSAEWRVGYIDGAIRVLLVFLLFLSIAPFLIVCLTNLIGNFPIEIAWLFAFAILISLIWLFYFGWLRGIAYQWEKTP